VGDWATEEPFDGELNLLDAKITAGLAEHLDDSVTDAAELAFRRRDRSRILARSRDGTPVSAAQSLERGRNGLV